MRGQGHAPAAPYPWERPGTHLQEAGWASGPVWTGAENLGPTGIRSPDRPAHRHSLYQLHYPAHNCFAKAPKNLQDNNEEWIIMYSYCTSMYSYCCLCILIVVYVFLDAATLTEVFPCFFLGCKANARVILAKTWHGPHSSKIVVLFYVLFVLYCSVYCLCVNAYCHLVTTQLQLTNISYQNGSINSSLLIGNSLI